MRRALVGTLAGWVASAACVLAQTPLPYGPVMTNAPTLNPPAAAGSSYSPYGRYTSSHADGAAYDEPPRPANPRYTTGVVPASAPGMANMNIPTPAPWTNTQGPNSAGVPVMTPSTSSAPVMPGSANGYAGPMNGGPTAVFTGGRGVGRYGNSSTACDGNCGDQGCSSCGGGPTCQPCPPCGRLWFGGEYLLWWSSGMSLPPLVTGAPPGTPLNIANPAGGAPIPVAGVLGQATTTTLFGGSASNNVVRSGARLRAGAWLDECNMLGVEGSFFFLGNQAQNFTSVALANNIVMRPFFNVSTGVQDAQIVSFPGVTTGTVSIDTRNDVYGADANLRRNLICNCNFRVDLIGGYRFMSMNDRLNILENLTAVNPAGIVPVGTTLIVNDRFETDNQFHGGQLGLAGEWRSGRVFVDWRGLVALGAGIKTVRINGTTTVTAGGAAPVVNAGGLLALPTNIGTYHSTDFSVLPELGVNLGFQVTDMFRFWVGYSFLYWNNVARAGNQIDFNVNSTQIPPGVLVGPASPTFTFRRSDYWLQGVSFGAQVRF